MSLKEHLKEEARVERQKMKEMSFQDKLWYIWEYYKFHIGGLIIAVMLIWVVATSIYNTTIHPALYCMVINNRSDQELDTTVLEEDFHKSLNLGKKEPIYVESAFISYGNNATEFSYASMAKISALVASRDLDIFITDRETLDHYSSLDGLADLRQVLPPDMLSAVEGRLIYADDSTGQSVAASIDISGTDFADRMHLSFDASGLCIVSNSTHTDHILALIRYIFGL